MSSIPIARNRAVKALALTNCFVFCLAGASFSQSLGTWNFSGTTNGISGSYNTVSPAAFTGVSSAGYSGSVYYGENGWPAGGITTSSYFEFSLTPAAGRALNILSVVLAMRRSSTGSPSGSGPRSFVIRSSVDNYTSDLGGGTLTHNVGTYTIVPPTGFDRLASTVTFRVYGYNTAISSGGLNRLVFDNIQVSGSNIILASPVFSLAAKTENNDSDVRVSLNCYSLVDDIFTIERSADGIRFYTVHEFVKVAGEMADVYTYHEKVEALSATKLYYRARVLHSDGSTSLSNVVSISVAKARQHFRMWVYRNRIVFSSALKGRCMFRLVSASGNQVLSLPVYASGDRNTVVTPLLTSGIYYGCLSNDITKEVAAIRVTR